MDVITRLEISGGNGSEDFKSYPIAVNIPISINYVLSDVREPDKRNASFSKTIQLFATNEINKLFENIFSINVKTHVFNKNLKTPVKYYAEDLLIFQGSLQLIKIVIKPDKNIVYECSIIGEGGSLFIDIGDKYITGNQDSANDLDFSAYDHIYDRATQIALNTANVGTGLGVLYPFVDRGTNGGSDTVFSVEDFLPGLSFWEYWNKIFEMAGYTYTSSIIDSDLIKKSVLFPNIINIPLTGTQINNSQFYLGEDGLGGGSTAINIQSASKYIFPMNGASGTPPFFDIGSQYNTGTYVVTLNENGKYNIASIHDLTILWSHTNPVVTHLRLIGLRIKSMIEYSTDSGSTWNELCSLTYDWKNQGVNDTQFDADFVVSIASGEVSLQAGTQLRNTIELNQAPLIFWKDAADNTINTGTGTWDVYWNSYNGAPNFGTQFYGLLTSKNITTGQTMVMNNALPVKIKQRDFIKSVIQALELQIEPDKHNPKHLYIESYKDFYNGEIINFENRTDLSKEQSVNPNLLEGKRYIWTYKKDSDYYNTLYQNTYQEAFGTETIVVDNDFTKQDKVSEIIFSPTPNVANYGLATAMPRIYSFENNVYKPIAQNIRWLYCDSIKTLPVAFTYKDTFDTDLITDQYLYGGHTDDPFNPTIDLNFGTPKEVYYNFIGAYFTNNNLYNRFHKAPTENITNRDSKFAVKYLWLKPYDINKFTFRQRWFIEDAYHIVNKIVDYDPTDKDSIQCELIKLLDSEIFTPEQRLLATEPNINTGNGVTPQVNNSSLSRGINNQNRGVNCIAIGNNIVIPADCENVTVIGNNVSVGDNTTNLSLINVNNLIVDSTWSGSTISNVSSFIGVESDTDVVPGTLMYLMDTANAGTDITLTFNSTLPEGVEFWFKRNDSSLTGAYKIFFYFPSETVDITNPNGTYELLPNAHDAISLIKFNSNWNIK